MNVSAPGFHARLKSASRQAILDAVERLMAHGGLDELTFAQVAQAAGVAERTVYRHFPTKEALLEAFWLHVQKRLGLEQSVRSFADYLATRPATFARMDERESMMRAVMSSAQARQARRGVLAERQAGIRRVVADAVGELPEPQFSELCALVHLLGSAPTWATLKDDWGIAAPRAGEIAARAIAILIAAAKADTTHATRGQP